MDRELYWWYAIGIQKFARNKHTYSTEYDGKKSICIKANRSICWNHKLLCVRDVRFYQLQLKEFEEHFRK